MKLKHLWIPALAAVVAFCAVPNVADAKHGHKDKWHKHSRYCRHDNHYWHGDNRWRDDYRRDDYRWRNDYSYHHHRVYIPRNDIYFYDGYAYHRPSRERLAIIYDGRGIVLGYRFRDDYNDRRYRRYYGDRYY
jgi:hypothetical protein